MLHRLFMLGLGLLLLGSSLPAAESLYESLSLKPREGKAAETKDWLASLRSAPASEQTALARQLRDEAGPGAVRASHPLLPLYLAGSVDELGRALADLSATSDDRLATDHAPERERAELLLNQALRLARGDARAKEEAVNVLIPLAFGREGDGPLSAATRLVATDALSLSLGAQARCFRVDGLGQLATELGEALATALPGDARALRRASVLHARVAELARQQGDTGLADAHEKASAALDTRLCEGDDASPDDLLDAALRRRRGGARGEAVKLLFRIQSLPTSAPAAAGDDDDGLRRLRLALLQVALGLGDSERGLGDAERAMEAGPAWAPLARAVFSPETQLDEGGREYLSRLRKAVDDQPLHPLRETLFLVQLRNVLRAAADLAGGRPIDALPLLEVCLLRHQDGLAEAAKSLRQALMVEALLHKWPGPGREEASRLRTALERLELAEYALLDQAAAGNPANGRFEAEVARATVDAVHGAFSVALLGGNSLAGQDPASLLEHTLPALGLRRQGKLWLSMDAVPGAWQDSWKEVQFELCKAVVARLSDSSDRAVLARHTEDAGGLATLAARLRPSQVADVQRTVAAYNDKIQQLNEQELAARRAREQERLRREEARRAAQAAAEAEARRRQEAEAYAQTRYQQQQRSEPVQRWRWCMRCAGTGTYSQYSTRQGSYGGYERVQGQVRCDRCWGTGKLP